MAQPMIPRDLLPSDPSIRVWPISDPTGGGGQSVRTGIRDGYVPSPATGPSRSRGNP